ncbi:acyl-CoA carboxylase subunit epsilon [Streptomyces sp. NRRL S-920]|uniref:acyl-CoA carboxylase subunit epsilon n=1 Tax=Streptomyces sp. NRRL S-920 TaxID=1463921 RepID=UPI000AFEF522|nr:acyl-CoA carboxylase subunit epsilon [Streptomyces sp. NRRL S-920]
MNGRTPPSAAQPPSPPHEFTVLRGQPTDEELAAVVSALLTVSRSRAVRGRGDGGNTDRGAVVRRRPWTWSGYRAPGSWQR